jgi:hypothetical protein
MKQRLVYGVGINDADYVTQLYEEYGYVGGKQKRKRVWVCPFYQTWKSMIERGYSERYKLKYATYKDATVCEDWHRFSNFRAWMVRQAWEGNELDKDLLFPGNKVYSPETCVFVSRQVNMFLTDSGRSRGNYKIGVHWDKNASKFRAQCSNPFTGEQEYLGCFTDEDCAHQAWLGKKLENAYALAGIQTDLRIAKAIVDRYENYG